MSGAPILTRAAYLARRREGLALASRAGAALDEGQPVPGLLHAWDLASDPALGAAAARALADLDADPPGDLCDPDHGPPDGAPTTERVWRQRHWEACDARVPRAPRPARRAWALAELAWWGEELRAWERDWQREWSDEPWGEPEAGILWTLWLGDAPGEALDRVQSALDPVYRQVFTTVVRGHRLPREAVRALTEDLAPGFGWRLMDDDPAGVPPRLDLGARVLETEGLGPIRALAPRLPADRWGVAARCLATRRSWAQTLRVLWPDLSGPEPRIARLSARLTEDPAWFGPLYDLHQLLRLPRAWREEGRPATAPDAGAAILRETQRRVRARMRSLIAEVPEALLPALLDLRGLRARTLEAARRHAWDWARRELRTEFALAQLSRVTLPCALPARGPRPLPGAALPILRCWVLLVILRGRLEHLRRWAGAGREGSNDAGWGRLLSKDLPRPCASPKRGCARAIGVCARRWRSGFRRSWTI